MFMIYDSRQEENYLCVGIKLKQDDTAVLF